MAAPPVDPLRRARPRDSHLRGDMTDRALLTTLHQTQSAFERQRGITVGHEGQVLSLARSAPATAHFSPCATPATRPAPRPAGTRRHRTLRGRGLAFPDGV